MRKQKHVTGSDDIESTDELIEGARFECLSTTRQNSVLLTKHDEPLDHWDNFKIYVDLIRPFMDIVPATRRREYRVNFDSVGKTGFGRELNWAVTEAQKSEAKFAREILFSRGWLIVAYQQPELLGHGRKAEFWQAVADWVNHQITIDELLAEGAEFNPDEIKDGIYFSAERISKQFSTELKYTMQAHHDLLDCIIEQKLFGPHPYAAPLK